MGILSAGGWVDDAHHITDLLTVLAKFDGLGAAEMEVTF